MLTFKAIWALRFKHCLLSQLLPRERIDAFDHGSVHQEQHSGVQVRWTASSLPYTDRRYVTADIPIVFPTAVAWLAFWRDMTVCTVLMGYWVMGAL